MKFYYCPVCGIEDIYMNDKCDRCGSYEKYIEEKYDISYYEEQSKKIYGSPCYSYEIVVETEISKNPLYNKELSEKLSKEEKEIEEKEQEEKRFQNYLKNVRRAEAEMRGDPKCPICGSYNIERISGLRRAAHAYAFGLFSNTAKSQFECLHCKYKF